ncbi:LysM peptidoglycan-binding domain-containing protein [Niallia taxi]|uniref:LysM peptidoglycan-binding domain-containing protein n=1 Tax=Niallia taxi TaxID=2499688 RepID=UPI00119F0EEE|nr:LysM peptidoglycan-binding domain-containing protein [Niallia taxi]MED3961884.1 LysM peptidoglycan-binding domain-containing protein [Niallia taxi]
MTREDPYRVQADRQKQRITRVEKQEVIPSENKEKEELPPRRSLHHKKKKKKKKNQKSTAITVLAFSFIALPVILLGIHEIMTRHAGDTTVPVSGSSTQFEQIGVEQKEKKSATVEDKDKIDDADEKSSKQAADTEDQQSTDKEQKAEKEAEQKAKAEAEKEAEQKAKAEAEKEAEQKAKAEAEKKAAEEAEKKAQAEAERKAAEEAKQKAQAEAERKAAEEAEKKAQAEAETTYIYHTVASNETLYRIAMNYYNSKSGVDIIKQANQLASDNVMVGQVLKIPQQ